MKIKKKPDLLLLLAIFVGLGVVATAVVPSLKSHSLVTKHMEKVTNGSTKSSAPSRLFRGSFITVADQQQN